MFEVTALGSLVAVAVAAGAIWLGPRADARQADEAFRDAAPLRRALEAWLDDNDRGCPSLSQLVYEKYLDDDARTDDPWGNRYRILCNDQPRVVSEGPDGRLGTADDFALRVGE